MPYRRSTRRFRPRRRSYGKFKARYGARRGRGRGRSVWRSISSINKRLTSEVKKFDQAVADATLNIGGVVFSLTGIAQGDLATNREGNAIRLKYLQIVGTITNGSVAGNANAIRCILIQDTQMVVGANTTVASVLENSLFNDLLNRVSMSAGRFNILYDQLFTMGTTGQNERVNSIKKYFNLSKLPVVKWTGATSTDFQNNHLFLMLIPQTDELGAVDLNVRVGYYDN